MLPFDFFGVGRVEEGLCGGEEVLVCALDGVCAWVLRSFVKVLGRAGFGECDCCPAELLEERLVL